MNNRRNGVNRMDKLNSEFKREIYEIISRKLKNPLISEMISVLDVSASKDLSFAKVYISVYSKSEEKRIATFNAIKEESKRIKYELSKSMIVRKVPELCFVLDDSINYGDKMDKLLLSIKKEDKREDK